MKWWRTRQAKANLESQLDHELQFHIEKLTEQKIAGGVPPEEARRQAVLKFGGVQQTKEELRDIHRPRLVENAVANLRAGIRFLRKAPSLSAAIIITLALGVGANTAVFSAVNAILLRPLPFPNGDQLMQLTQYDIRGKGAESPVAPARLEDWNKMNSSFQGIAGYYTQNVSETSGALPEEITAALVSPRFFEVWGISPVIGRGFLPEEHRMGARGVAVISDRLWKRRFGSGDAVGKSLRVGPITYTIVGVMPASFLFPNHDVDFWEALPVDGPLMLVREATWYNAVGRLKPGVALAQARSDLGIVQAQLGKQYPKTDATLAVHIEPLKSMTVGDVQKSLWILFGAVTVLLLIACTNIAALLLARTTERQREIAIRYSVGASRGSIIALLLTEIFVLALAGSALALLVAQTMSRVFTDLAKNLPRVEEIGMDGRVVLYTLACAIVTTLLCGLVPAIRGTKRELAGSLAQGGRSQVRGRSSLQWFLVSLQVALAVILLVGAGLLLRSFQAIARVAPGFETDHVLALRISADWAETADIKKMQQRVNRDLDGLRSVAGVEGAATSVFVPGVSSGPPVEVSIKEGAADGNQKIMAASRLVSPSYFATMHIPLLEGEACRESFGIPAMVNRSFAETYLSGRTTIGRHVQFVPANPYMPPSEIRGIVGDAREEGLQLQVGPVVYWCSSAPMPSPVFLVRTHGDPMALAETIRRKLHEVEPTRSVYEIMPLDQHLRENMAENRMRTTLLTFFATVAVLLACVGLYGTLSYVVSVRRGEVGLRLALGALRRQIVLQFLREGLAASLLGCLAGLILAAVFARVLRGMLYGVTSSDPDTFVAVALLVLVTAVVSSLLPAARAARLQPMQVLREE